MNDEKDPGRWMRATSAEQFLEAFDQGSNEPLVNALTMFLAMVGESVERSTRERVAEYLKWKAGVIRKEEPGAAAVLKGCAKKIETDDYRFRIE